MRQRRIVALHMKGWSNEEIGRALGIQGAAVSVVLRNSTTQAIISDLLMECDEQMRAMAPLAVKRLRKTLETPTDQRVGLQAVDLYMKTQHKYREAPERARTAEDVIQEILKIRTDGAATIEIGRQEVKRDS